MRLESEVSHRAETLEAGGNKWPRNMPELLHYRVAVRLFGVHTT